jgi:hypothetical protein
MLLLKFSFVINLEREDCVPMTLAILPEVGGWEVKMTRNNKILETFDNYNFYIYDVYICIIILLIVYLLLLLLLK